MKKLILGLGLVLLPSFAFAADDSQIRANILQQLLSTFVVEVNSLDKIQSLVAQSSSPSQFDAFSGAIAQQLSETTGQLATLLNGTANVPVPVSNMPLSGIGAPAGAVVQSPCIDSPVLTLTTEDRGVNPKDDLPNPKHDIRINGEYTTGCPLDKSTAWTFKTLDWRSTGDCIHYNDGTLANAGCYTSGWSLSGPTPGEAVYDIAYFSAAGSYPLPQTFIVTVGGVTATTTVQ